jgi:two-component system nitrate/nitrite response regulator NarL
MLLDVGMPGGGIEAARSIARACPNVRMIMLTVSEREQGVAQALEAGAMGYQVDTLYEGT